MLTSVDTTASMAQAATHPGTSASVREAELRRGGGRMIEMLGGGGTRRDYGLAMGMTPADEFRTVMTRVRREMFRWSRRLPRAR